MYDKLSLMLVTGCVVQCSRQSSKLGRLGENVGQSEDESSDEELSYMSSKQSSLMNQRRPKSPSTKFTCFSLI